MGIYEPEAAAEPWRPGSAPLSASASISDWLDGLLTTVNSRQLTSVHAEVIRSRLKDIPFREILASIERNPPSPGGAAEIGLYQHWIDANGDTSPLLYAAWFNIGVLFAREGDNGNATIAY